MLDCGSWRLSLTQGMGSDEVMTEGSSGSRGQRAKTASINTHWKLRLLNGRQSDAFSVSFLTFLLKSLQYELVFYLFFLPHCYFKFYLLQNPWKKHLNKSEVLSYRKDVRLCSKTVINRYKHSMIIGIGRKSEYSKKLKRCWKVFIRIQLKAEIKLHLLCLLQHT